MLSRVMTRGLIRKTPMMARMAVIPARNFTGHLGLSVTNLTPVEFNESDQVSLWKDIKAK